MTFSDLKQIENNFDESKLDEYTGEKILAALFDEIINQKAVGLSIESVKDKCLISFYSQGTWNKVLTLPQVFCNDLIEELKRQSNIGEVKGIFPQEHGFKKNIKDKEFQLRLNLMPGVYGPKAYLKFINAESEAYDLESLGIEGDNLKKFKEAINKSYGMVLVTGMDSSVNKKILYTGVELLKGKDLNIVTIEKEIQNYLDDIFQAQIRPEIGFDKVEGLNALMKQEPDVIMIDEIVDDQEVELALRAALSGHLVLTSMVAKDAIAALEKILSAGAEPFMVSAGINAVISLPARLRRSSSGAQAGEAGRQSTVDSQEVGKVKVLEMTEKVREAIDKAELSLIEN